MPTDMGIIFMHINIGHYQMTDFRITLNQSKDVIDAESKINT